MLPAGSGKSLCYAALPYVFDSLRGENRASIVLVVSPLQSIMEDQVKKYTARGLHVAFLGKGQRDERVRAGIVHESMGYSILHYVLCRHQIILCNKVGQNVVLLPDPLLWGALAGVACGSGYETTQEYTP